MALVNLTIKEILVSKPYLDNIDFVAPMEVLEKFILASIIIDKEVEAFTKLKKAKLKSLKLEESWIKEDGTFVPPPMDDKELEILRENFKKYITEVNNYGEKTISFSFERVTKDDFPETNDGEPVKFSYRVRKVLNWMFE